MAVCGNTWAQTAADEINAFLDQTLTGIHNGLNNFVNDYISDYNIITSSTDDLSNIAGQYKNLECVEAKDAMADHLSRRGVPFGVVEIRYPSKPGYIYSDTYNKVISENGYHVGIYVNGSVYCNVHPYGLPMNLWIGDFDGVGPRTITIM